MVQDLRPETLRVPKSAGLTFPEVKLQFETLGSSGLRVRRPNDIEARQRVHATAFSEPFAGCRAAITD